MIENSEQKSLGWYRCRLGNITGSNVGLITYDIYRFKTWRTDTNKVNTIKSNGVYCIYEDRNNQLWIGTENGLYIFDKKKESFERINGFGIENTLIRSISEDNKGNIWATSLGNGIYKYTPKNKKSIHVEYFRQRNGHR